MGQHSYTSALPIGRPLRFRGLARWPDLLRQAEFGRGRQFVAVTMGQGGSLDLVDALLRLVDGPEHLVFSMWSFEGADLRRVEAWCDRAALVSARWVVDESAPGRHPEGFEILRRRFGECFRTARMHAKFILLSGGGWNIVALTSASLDPARRLEHWWVSDDPELFRFVSGVAAGRNLSPVPIGVPLVGFERIGFSDGSWSFVDLLERLIVPGDPVTVASWTVNPAHVERVYAADPGSVRWLVDASMKRGRTGRFLEALRDRAGDQNIRGCSVHGKFARVGCWSILTSANLNPNPRTEQFIVSRDPRLARLLDGLVGEVWNRSAAPLAWGVGFQSVNKWLMRMGGRCAWAG